MSKPIPERVRQVHDKECGCGAVDADLCITLARIWDTFEAGRQAERDAAVEWLRDVGPPQSQAQFWALHFACRIEGGDHVAKEGDDG